MAEKPPTDPDKGSPPKPLKWSAKVLRKGAIRYALEQRLRRMFKKGAPPTSSLPKPTVRALFKAVFWDRWVGAVTLLWGIYGVVDWLGDKVIPALWPEYKSTWERFYHLPSLTWHTWLIGAFFIVAVVALHGAFKFAQSYRKRYEELIKDKLVFEIDGERTSIRVEQKGSDGAGLVVWILLSITLRFENLDPTHPTSMKKLSFSLYRGAKEIFTWFSILYSSEGQRIEKNAFEGMMVQGGRLTPWYLVEALLTVADDTVHEASDIEVMDYVELTMEVGGYQEPFTARFHPHWTGALKAGGTNQIVVTGAKYIDRDFRRFN